MLVNPTIAVARPCNVWLVILRSVSYIFRFRAYFKSEAKDKGRTVTITQNNDRGFEQQLGVVKDALLERWGIELGETEWLIHAKPLIGRKLQYNGGRPNEVRIWGEVQCYPLQNCVVGLATEDPRPALESIEQIFMPDCRVFVLNRQYYGCIGHVKGTVVEITPIVTNSNKKVLFYNHGEGVTEGGSVSVRIDARNDIDLQAVRESYEVERKGSGKELKWLPGWRMAQCIGISSYVLSRITGVLYIFNQEQKGRFSS